MSTKAGKLALLVADTEGALTAFRAAIAANPADHEAYYGLAAALMQGGEPAHAELDNARVLHTLSLLTGLSGGVAGLKADPAYGAQVGLELYGKHLVACASVVWGMSLSAGEIDSQGLLNYALSLQHQGRVEEAAQYLQVAVENFPSPALHQFLIYALLFCEDGEARHAEAARDWSRRWAELPPPAPHGNASLAGRKLRVGYVAPRFATSQLRQFVAPLFEGHDPETTEVVLYPAEAASETGCWPAFVQIRPIGHLNDEAAAALIRKDRIDVLNDLWGHTAGSRLGVFARKPAPVQVGWINFAQTTGLPQMDYVLHARASDAPAFPELFSEEIWGAGEVFWPYRPAEGRLDPAPTPARAAGHVTFGSFHHPAKLSDGCLAAWATVLRNMAGSRLVLKYRYFADPVLQAATTARFAAHAVGAEQLIFEGETSGEAYYGAFRRIDVMLDCWPAPGSTTTLEALSNGVPVLSMVGETPNVGGLYARTILRASGLEELATTTPEGFVAKALELARDAEGLDAVRARVRPGFDGGANCDEAGFMRDLDAAFRAMFERWAAAKADQPTVLAAG